MEVRDRRRLARRVRLLGAGLVAGLGLAGARAAELQLEQHDQLSRLARDQYLAEVTVPARRGQIYDRSGKALAISVDVPSVWADPSSVTDPRRAARDLAAALELDVDLVYGRLASDRLFVWLKRQVSPAEADAVRALKLAGVGITQESRRFYPNREVAAHALGFVGVDGRGLEGLERAFERELAGEPQVVETFRDARGKAVFAGELDPDRRSSGADLHLTLDVQIQHAAEQALKKHQRQTGAKSATAVVLDVPTGDILALAVQPAWNPNVAGSASPDARRNRAITDVFEPASTMKPLVVAAALDAKVLRHDAVLFCENGSLSIGSHTIRDMQPHGWLSLTGILQKSSNIGAAKTGQALGADKLHAALKAFGFGQRTGVGLPGEAAGLLHDHKSWSDVGVATMSYGHGVAVTLVQLGAAYRALAADGVYVPPRLVRSVDGGAMARPVEERRVVSVEVARRVRKMLETAVGPEGTGHLAQIPGYRIAGKTGTAEKPDPVAGGYSVDRHVALFAGMLPAEAPRLVVVVALDEPQKQHMGGTVAAPIFADIAGAAARTLGIVPDQAIAAAASAPERLAAPRPVESLPPRPGPVAGPGAMPSFMGLTARQVVDRFSKVGRGLDLEMSGSGRVVRQVPEPGSERAGATRLSLVLGEP